MKKVTEIQLIQMLREAAVRRFGEEKARELLPVLRATARAIMGTRDFGLRMEDEPIFFSR